MQNLDWTGIVKKKKATPPNQISNRAHKDSVSLGIVGIDYFK